MVGIYVNRKKTVMEKAMVFEFDLVQKVFVDVVVVHLTASLCHSLTVVPASKDLEAGMVS